MLDWHISWAGKFVCLQRERGREFVFTCLMISGVNNDAINLGDDLTDNQIVLIVVIKLERFQWCPRHIDGGNHKMKSKSSAIVVFN